MSEIIVQHVNSMAWDEKTLNGIYSLRHKIFSEKLGWDVTSDNGMERDDYDDINPVYLVAKDDSQYVEGFWRLLPSTGPNMLNNTFQQLLNGDSPPNDPDIWELSRFAVLPRNSNSSEQITINPVTFQMIRSVVEYADKHKIKRYVTVTSVALEKLLKRIGIPVQRFGNRKAQHIGRVLSVACQIDINNQLRDVVGIKNSGKNSLEDVA